MKFGVICGHWSNDDGEFVTRTNEWCSYSIPNHVQDLTPEEIDKYNEDYDYDEIYMTTDGKLFYESKNAKQHQESIETPELNLLADKLGEIMIFCEKNLDKSHVFKTVKQAIGILDGDGGNYLLDKYYDSTCW